MAGRTEKSDRKKVSDEEQRKRDRAARAKEREANAKKKAKDSSLPSKKPLESQEEGTDKTKLTVEAEIETPELHSTGSQQSGNAVPAEEKQPEATDVEQTKAMAKTGKEMESSDAAVKTIIAKSPETPATIIENPTASTEAEPHFEINETVS